MTEPISATELVNFLFKRLAEEETLFELPQFSAIDSVREGWGNRGDCLLCGHYMFDGNEATTAQAWHEHIDEYHSQQLRSIKLRKQLVELGYGTNARGTDQYVNGWRAGLLFTLQVMAQQYRDHADFKPGWKMESIDV